MIARMETSATAAAATSAPRLRLAKRSLFDPMIVRSALPQSLRKLVCGYRPVTRSCWSCWSVP